MENVQEGFWELQGKRDEGVGGEGGMSDSTGWHGEQTTGR